jgi:hypothetical protein
MRKVKRMILALIVGLAAPAFLAAGTVGPITGNIEKLYTFAQFGTGDVAFTLSSPNAVCTAGYWVRMTDPGAKAIVAQLLSAYHAQKAVTVGAYDNQIWAGSASPFCLIDYVSYMP